MKTTEVVDLAEEKVSSKYGVCYAGGSEFKPTGKGSTSFVVEVGKRRLVSRALCVVQYFKARCQSCPFSKGDLTLVARGDSV
jgi:hypothetical protein